MGNEAYTAFLPWVVFAVVGRGHGDGIFWAAVCALITIAALMLTQHRVTSGPPNILLRAAVPLFVLLGAVGRAFDEPTGWFTRNARGVSALGFVIVAIASLVGPTIAEFYTRPDVRPSRWNTRAFDHLNVMLTLIWAVAFALVGMSHFVAAWIDSQTATTTFNWVLPVAIAVVAIHRSRALFYNFVDDNDESPETPDPLWYLDLEWPVRER